MKDQPQPKGSSPEEKVGRALGKAFLRVKKTKIWKDTAKAYQEGREGKR
jgi:hypothetical protein